MSTKSFRELLQAMGASAAKSIAAGEDRTLVLEAAGRAALSAGVPEQISRLSPSFALAWAQSGFATVEPSHRLSASLMATSLPREHVDNLVRMPWRCFGFHVPPGLLGDEPAFALVLHTRSASIHMLSLRGRQLHWGLEPSLADWNLKILKSEGNETFTSDEMERSARESELIGRLFLGICAEMSEHREANQEATTTRGKRQERMNRRAPYTYKLTRNVKVDVRGDVRDYIEGRRSRSPLVQTLVRGHWKAQACGHKSSTRKLIHVEPYWRGPEDAPVAVRSHEIGGPQSLAAEEP